MLAVIKTGGKQYLVKIGDKIKVEKLPGKEGRAIKFDTLLTTDEKGTKVDIGKPLLKLKVEGKILKQDKAKKLIVIKFKSKTRYTRRIGHRQPFSLIEIEKI